LIVDVNPNLPPNCRRIAIDRRWHENDQPDEAGVTFWV
jgi:hypothetical protein